MNTSYNKKKIKRTRQIRRRLLLFISTVLLIAIISFFGFGTKAKAESKENIQLYKYYKSVCVMPNDSLWNYAEEYAPDSDYERYIEEVVRMNNLQEYKINEGMNIIVPYYSFEFID